LEAEILESEVNVQAIREARIKSILIIIGRCERIFGIKGNVAILTHIEKGDAQLDNYLKAYEKIAPSEGESLVEKLTRKRKEKEAKKISSDFVSKDISEAFIKARIFQDVFEGKGWLRGAYNHDRDIAFFYIDEIARWAFDNYPTTWANDATIRILSLTLIHELTHEDFPRIGVNHRHWNRFLARTLWEYLR